MAGHQVQCPECRACLRTTPRFQPGSPVKCPSCGITFRPGAEAVTARPAARPRRPAAEDPDLARPPAPGPSPLLVGGMIAGAVCLLLLVAGAGLALWWGLRTTTPAPAGTPPPMPQVAVGDSRPVPPPVVPGHQPRVPDPADPPPPEVPPSRPEPGEPPRLVLDAHGHTAPVPSALFTPDARQVITASADKTVRVWDVETGETVRIFRVPIGPGPEGKVRGAALSPDGQTLALGGYSPAPLKNGILIYLVDWKSGQVEKVIRGNRQPISHLAFSPDGRRIASATPDGLSLVFDVESGKTVATLRGHRALVHHVAFSPDSKWVATSSADRTARVWEVETGREVAVLAEHRHECNCSAWSPDGKTLATGGVDGEIRLWDTASWEVRQRFPCDEPRPAPVVQVISLDYTPDGKRLLYSGIGATGRAGMLDLATGERLKFAKHTNTVMDGRLSRDGTLAVTAGGDDHETYVWKTADAAEVCRLQGDGRSVWGVGWQPDGKTVAWGNINRTLPGIGGTFLEHTFDLEKLALGGAPEGKVLRARLDTGGYSLRALDFFRVAIERDGEVVHVFQSTSPGDRIYSYTLLNGPWAVMGGSFGLYLVDIRRKITVQSFQGHTGLILSVTPSPDGRYFLTGSSDQTMRLWDPNQKEPLLSLFVAGQDWIAWTPQGYYACSAYGERLMGWQVNDGPERLGSYHPAARFRPSLYAPEVISLLLKEGSVAKALAKAGRDRLGGVTVAHVLPPEVRITSPARRWGNRTDQPRLEISAVATGAGEHPVTAMRLLVDGRPYRGREGVRTFPGGQKGEARASWEVDLLPGLHTLAVLAESPVSKGMSAPVEVTREAGKDDPLPNLYLLACGVSRYRIPELRLNFAASDAEAFSAALGERWSGVFGKFEARPLVDEQATRTNILAGLRWLKETMTPGDVGVVFLSGHGDRGPGGEFSFIPVDFDPERQGETCVSGAEIKRALEEIPGRLVVVLDACHAGSIAGSGPGRHPSADDLARDLVSDEYGVVVMCSSMGREYSLEGLEAGAGFYTRGLVEGLSGRADANKDRVVYIHELNVYAAARVRQLSGGMQNPMMGKPPGIPSFPLGKY